MNTTHILLLDRHRLVFDCFLGQLDSVPGADAIKKLTPSLGIPYLGV